MNLDAVSQHRNVHHVGPGIDQGDDLVVSLPGLGLDGFEGRQGGVGLHVITSAEPGGFGCGDTIFDLLFARSGDQHLVSVGAGAAGR